MKKVKMRRMLSVASTEAWIEFWEKFDPEKGKFPEGLSAKDQKKLVEGETLEQLKERKLKHHRETLARLSAK